MKYFLSLAIGLRATLSENYSLLGTDNVRGKISEHIFAPNGGYCLFIPQFLHNLHLYTCIQMQNVLIKETESPELHRNSITPLKLIPPAWD